MTSSLTTSWPVLRPEPGVDPVRSLRRGLKLLLRVCGLRVIGIREHHGANDFSKRQSTEMRRLTLS